MADNTNNEQESFMKLGNLVVDYSDNDIAIYDHVSNVSQLLPLKPSKNLIAMCSSGYLTIRVDEKTYTIRANDVLFCPPNVCIDPVDISSDFECKVLSLSDRIIQGLLHDKIEIWHRAVYINNVNVISMSEVCKQEFVFYYSLILSKIQNHKVVPYDILQALIRALLLELCQILANTQGPADDVKPTQGRMLFNRFLKLISSNEVKRRPITHYAGQLAITPKYLTMLCLKYSNKTASDWIVQYTIEDIRFYLRNSNLSIKEISAKLGFANMSHFGSYVRKHLGASPSDFRHER